MLDGDTCCPRDDGVHESSALEYAGVVPLSLLAIAALAQAPAREEPASVDPARQSAPTSTATPKSFGAVVAERSRAELRAWVAEHPWRAGTEVRGLLAKIQELRSRGEAEKESNSREDAAFVAGALEDELFAPWIRGVLAWSAEACARYDAASRVLDAAPASLTSIAKDPSAEKAARARIDAATSSAPPGALPLFAQHFIGIVRALASAFDDLSERAQRMAHDPITAAAAAEAARVHDGRSLAWFRNLQGQGLWMSADLEGAARDFEESFELSRAVGDLGLAVKRACDLAEIDLNRGDLERSLARAGEAEEIARGMGDGDSIREALMTKVESLTELGELEPALELLDAVEREQASTTSHIERLASDYLQHGYILAEVGRLESARTYFDRALALSETEAVRAEVSTFSGAVWLATALLYGDMGMTERALADADRAIEFYRAAGDPSGVATAQKNRGSVLMAARRFAEAAAAFDQALEYTRSASEPELDGFSALGRAEAALHESPLPNEIAGWLDTAQRIGERLRNFDLVSRSEAARGELAARAGSDASALDHLRRSVEAMERLRKRFSAPGLLSHALRGRSNPYREAAFAAAHAGDETSAWSFAELLRARVLQELRATRSGPLLQLESDAEVVRARRALAASDKRLAAESPRADREEERTRNKSLEDALDAALVKAELRAPRAARLSGASEAPFDVERAAALLESSGTDTLVEYVVGERTALALVIGRKGRAMQILKTDETKLAERIASLREPIEALGRGELDVFNLGFDQRAARELYDALLRPIEPLLGETVAIVADGPLTSLPFDLLVSGGTASRIDLAQPFAHLSSLRFTIEDRAFVYPTCARSIGAEAPADREKGSIACFETGRGFSSGAAELAPLLDPAAAQFAPAREMRDASAAGLKDAMRSARFVHIAAHGVLDADHPAHSHLVFGTRDAPERLEAWEIESVPMGAELVVLSACHGGEGRFTSGEGLLGLTRSFLAAGASEVIASAWSVEDRATSDLMRSFYAKLARGESTSGALRHAILELKSTRDARGFARVHPYFWAGWMLCR